MLLHVSLAIVSVHPHLRERAGWIDRWIKLTEIRLIGFNIICVRFSEVCTSGFQKSGLRIFGTLDFCFPEVLTSDFRKSGKILLWRGFWRYCPRRKTLDVQLCRPPLSLFDALDQSEAFPSVQLGEQLDCLFVTAIQVGLYFIQRVVDIDAAILVVPAIFGR